MWGHRFGTLLHRSRVLFASEGLSAVQKCQLTGCRVQHHVLRSRRQEKSLCTFVKSSFPSQALAKVKTQEDTESSSVRNCNKYTTRSYNCGELSSKHVDQRVYLQGWLLFKRVRGIFVLKDAYGKTQAMISSTHPHLKEVLENAGLESVLRVSGMVVLRPPKQQRPNEPTGEIEVIVNDLTVLGDAINLKFSAKDYPKVHEDLLMKYRYLSFRSDVLQNRLRVRANVIKRNRDFLHDNSFVE